MLRLLSTRDLLRHLNQCSDDRPWRQLRPGKQVTEIWLAHQLRPFGISPRTMRLNGLVAKGYLNADFEEAYRRYGVWTLAEAQCLRSDVQGRRARNADRRRR